jgi:DNA-binding LytR/AlgR family response regulator
LSEVLNDCTLALKEEPKKLLLKSSFGYHKIYLRDIEYIEAQNKRVVFFLTSGQSLLITEPLYSFENKLLTQDGFFQCHRSYIVSMSYVNSFTSSDITMKSGNLIPIARGIGKAFQDAYFSFMFGN